MRLLKLQKSLILWALFISIFAEAKVPDHLLIQGPPSKSLPISAQVLVNYETGANPLTTNRSSQAFWIEHLEIPLSALEKDQGLGLDKEILESMLFEKNGEPHVRWILNPEDTKFGIELANALSEKGIPFTRGRHYIGYLTSSRSCIVQDPITGVTFSIKSSTNQTAGSWKDKKETVRAARAARLMSDYILTNFDTQQIDKARIVHEPLAFYYSAADQGIVVRQYDIFKGPPTKVLVPVFAYVHKAANFAGSQNPQDIQQYISKNLMVPAGTATAELLMNFGIFYNSPHGQNVLVELENNRPTGRLYFRDYADSHLASDIMILRSGGIEILRHYKTFTSGSNKIMTSHLEGKFGPYYNGSRKIPSWVHNEELLKSTFSHSFRTAVASLISSPGRKISIPQNAYYSTGLNWNQGAGNYWGTSTSTTGNGLFNKYLSFLNHQRATFTGPRCSLIFGNTAGF